MALANLCGQMAINMRVTTKMDLGMAKENTLLRAKDGMKENGSLVHNQEMENIAKVSTWCKESGKKDNFSDDI